MRRTSTPDVDLGLVLDARELWPRVRQRFSDPRLRDLDEDLESSGVERVLNDRDALALLDGAEREAGVMRALTVGAVDEARRITGSSDPHVRKKVSETAFDRDFAGEDANIAAVELLEHLNLTEQERVIAGCYAIGCRDPRDITAATGISITEVHEHLRSMVPYIRGMLADHVAPSLAEDTRVLICRYAQGDLEARRDWRQRQCAHRLVQNNPDCLRLYAAQRATDQRLRILLPIPALAALVSHKASDEASEHAARTIGAARQHVTDAAGSVKRHALAAYQKTVDPTPLAGVRPGAAAAVLASCVSIGGGATYCLNASVNPLQAITNTTKPASHRTRPVAHKPSQAAQLLAAPIPTPPPAPPAPAPSR
ncbi:MAG: hypothetical protein M3065_13945, partial [Actinomycetota bacterium]|nr:hypothetical protein [Actinomycetota bacterium]